MLRQQRPRQNGLISVVLAVCAVVALAGCASSQHTSNGRTSPGEAGFVKSGFLSDYSRLQPSENPELPTAFIYRNTEKNLSIYRIIMLERVAVHLRPGAYAAKVHPKELESLAGFFEDEIKHSLGESYPLVSDPGFGVIKIRAAIVDVAPNMSGSSESSGNAAIEMEFLDSLSGEQLAAVVDTRSARGYRLSKLGDTWGFTKDLLHLWAVLVRDSLDESKGLHRGSAVHSTGNTFR